MINVVKLPSLLPQLSPLTIAPLSSSIATVATRSPVRDHGHHPTESHGPTSPRGTPRTPASYFALALSRSFSPHPMHYTMPMLPPSSMPFFSVDVVRSFAPENGLQVCTAAVCVANAAEVEKEEGAQPSSPLPLPTPLIYLSLPLPLPVLLFLLSLLLPLSSFLPILRCLPLCAAFP